MNVEACWKWAVDNNCQTGLCLFLLCVILTMLGDGTLYMVSPVKAAKPELAPTALIRPIANLVLSSWFFYFTFQTIVNKMGWAAFMTYFSSFFTSMMTFCIWFLGYAYRGPSKGITINVREPKQVSFGKLNYSHDKSAMAPSLFYNFAWIHLSAFLVPFEMCIHIVMGNDITRIEDEGGAESCEGMMAQEMNHGKAQLLYSKAAEKDFGFPPGYRKLFKGLLLNVPSQVSLAIVCCVESALVMYTALLASYPSLFKAFYPDTKTQWLWAWHFLEETEHCWDSVEDSLERTTAPILWMTWPLLSVYFMIVFSTSCLVESILYAPLSLLNPLTFIPNLCTWILGFTIIAPSIVVNNALRLLLRMKPSDESYTDTTKKYRQEIYLKICGDEMFQTTHVQLPHKNLKNRESVTLSQFPMTNRGSIRNSLVFNQTKMQSSRKLDRCSVSFVNQSLGENIVLSAEQEKDIKRLRSFRLSMYEKTEQDLMASGLFSSDEIDDAGFSRKSLRNLCVDIQAPVIVEESSDSEDGGNE